MVRNNMKRGIFFLTGIFLIIGCICLITSAEVTSCCEKEITGAWCQNSPASHCDTNFRDSQTSCDATSFCKKGCCVDTQEGLCMENTPQKVCEMGTGTWVADAQCNVPQCKLGCCILGDQASFVTLTRCKKLSSFYGLETNFNTKVNDEPTCILLAYSQDKGACVYEFENQKTCKFSTRKECDDMNKKKGGTNTTSKTIFFKDFLCSADELGTNCGPSTKTTCIDGKNEAYFVDTCGNPANIYDSNRANDPSYWKKIVKKADSCGANSANIGSSSCGNCEYFKGSICAKGNAVYGDYSCKDLNCKKTQNGKNYKNGESWCVYQGDVGYGADAVGSRHFRHICVNGEEITEPCADFRNEICIENELQTNDGNFIESACRKNRWESCIDQTEQKNCLNTDKRDCFWTNDLGLRFVKRTSTQPSGTTSSTSSSSAPFSGSTATQFGGSSGSSSTTTITSVGGVELSENNNVCLPMVKPGLKFWNDGDASKICSLGNSVCIVGFEKRGYQIVKDWIIGEDSGKGKCVDNCACLTEEWVKQVNKVCTGVGDCGANVNIQGRYTDDGVEWKVDGEKKTIQRGLINNIRR